MATHIGSEGSVAVGANTVAEVLSWEVTSTMEPAEDTALGDTWKTHKAGEQSWSGTLTCMWDETDTNGQEALTVGASVTLNLYPEGSTTGDARNTGTALITEVGVSVPGNGAIITRSFAFVGTGALTVDTVP